MSKKHVFGPVPSRRLGRSLGVDLVPYKYCSFDCIYCQLGRTTQKTIERKEYVPTDEVISDVRDKLDDPGIMLPDYITFSGSGEPTLHSGIGRMINEIKEFTAIPVAVLTNGSLLYQPEVRKEISRADLVVPSLDAGDEETYRKMNRPVEGISFEKIISGLIRFRKEFDNRIWLEVFLVAGINDTEDQVRKIAEYIREIKPDRIQVNTTTRPAAEDYAKPVPPDRLHRLAEILYPTAEVIADFRHSGNLQGFAPQKQDVLDLLMRRPCSLEDISAGLGLHKTEAGKYAGELIEEGVVEKLSTSGKTYFKGIASSENHEQQ